MGVGGPLLNMTPRVSSLSPSSENHFLGTEVVEESCLQDDGDEDEDELGGS